MTTPTLTRDDFLLSVNSSFTNRYKFPNKVFRLYIPESVSLTLTYLIGIIPITHVCHSVSVTIIHLLDVSNEAHYSDSLTYSIGH